MSKKHVIMSVTCISVSTIAEVHFIAGDETHADIVERMSLFEDNAFTVGAHRCVRQIAWADTSVCCYRIMSHSYGLVLV